MELDTSVIAENLGVFQSLVGFKINWNQSKLDIQQERQEFQSLVGFKINWNKLENEGY